MGIPTSLKKIYPIKYPIHAPETDPVVAINAILNQLFILAIVIGIIKRSGGKGNIKLSITETKNAELRRELNIN